MPSGRTIQLKNDFLSSTTSAVLVIRIHLFKCEARGLTYHCTYFCHSHDTSYSHVLALILSHKYGAVSKGL